MTDKHLSVDIKVFPASEVYSSLDGPVEGLVLLTRVKDESRPIDKCVSVLWNESPENLTDYKVIGAALLTFANALQKESKYQ
jgi:hypothetical protein